ncbi:glycosyltransferase [Mycolicibacterium frederiksbergense]|uniref:glycosyltransferase n=1 Tax=Mycolicibacterium frederiksbergense TaxID=117567 RepID=UPI00265C1AC8|nr:glycosyltransferase [Mycolicibacterium frederiksbergense]MDO0972825.1 glycosyltransferase [Mycolicibacterium frederiksbergense]
MSTHGTGLAPIAIFAYNRPDRLQRLFESLLRCPEFHDTTVTVFVDGPKRDIDRVAVEQVRSLVKNQRLPNVAAVYREENHGLRRSIYAGVTEMVGKYGRVIVLEDDLVVSPAALTYFNSALRHYDEHQRVWSIVGYVYDAPSLRNAKEALVLPFTHPWGWATWSRAWDHFALDNYPEGNVISSRSFRSAFDMQGLYPFTNQLGSSIQGRVNSWFIHWYYAMFINGGVSIFPPRRLVDNYGLSAGSHGGSLNPYDRLVTRPPLLDRVPGFGKSIAVDYPALDALRRCHELRVHRFIARAGTAKRTLRPGGYR